MAIEEGPDGTVEVPTVRKPENLVPAPYETLVTRATGQQWRNAFAMLQIRLRDIEKISRDNILSDNVQITYMQARFLAIDTAVQGLNQSINDLFGMLHKRISILEDQIKTDTATVTSYSELYPDDIAQEHNVE